MGEIWSSLFLIPCDLWLLIEFTIPLRLILPSLLIGIFLIPVLNLTVLQRIARGLIRKGICLKYGTISV